MPLLEATRPNGLRGDQVPISGHVDPPKEKPDQPGGTLSSAIQLTLHSRVSFLPRRFRIGALFAARELPVPAFFLR